MNAMSWLMSATLVGAAAMLGCASGGTEDPPAGQMAELSSSGDAAMADISYGNIPRNAMKVSSGRGILRFRVQKPGTVWVGDDDAKQELLEQGVVLDDVIEVNPYAGEIKLNGQVISNQQMDKKHHHAIFYLDARKRPRSEGGAE